MPMVFPRQLNWGYLMKESNRKDQRRTTTCSGNKCKTKTTPPPKGLSPEKRPETRRESTRRETSAYMESARPLHGIGTDLSSTHTCSTHAAHRSRNLVTPPISLRPTCRPHLWQESAQPTVPRLVSSVIATDKFVEKYDTRRILRNSHRSRNAASCGKTQFRKA